MEPSLQQIEQAAQKGWLDGVVKQLNAITLPPRPQQYNVEQAKIDEKAIAAAGTKRPKITASQEAVAAAHVAEWMADFDKHGRKGYVGLVPRPLQSKYPAATATAAVISADTVQCVEHFCAWFLNNKK
jgi:hypothetical protein